MKIVFRKVIQFINQFLEKHPVLSFIVILSIFVILIVLGNISRKPVPAIQATQTVKNVSVYTVGSVPRVVFQAKVEKTGIVQVTASASGVVNGLRVKEGSKVTQGTILVNLANNYTGSNAASLSRQLAEKQNQMVESTYNTQKDIISKQRDLAKKTYNNYKEMQDINKKSIDSTNDIINLNEQIISSISANIQSLSADPTENASLILSSQQLLSQFLSANNQLKASVRNTKIQTDTDKSQTKLAEDQKSLTLKQLDVQETSLDVNREISALQVKLARINESMMYPAAPFNGVVEQVFVREGQMINPGTLLMTISSFNINNLKAVMYLPFEMAIKLSRIEKTKFMLGSKAVELLPSYVSSEATNGELYSVIYMIPTEYNKDLADNSYISAQVPVGYINTSSVVPYIPLDAIYQTQESSYVFIYDNGKAISKRVEVGEVFGSYVRITSGLGNNDQIIVDRNVADGDSVRITN
jgi:multidrug efflux pump subunit AcrA (membrane-fusion protein)